MNNKNSVLPNLPTNASTWSDDRFDYFRTSDGKVWCVPRNFEREAAEAEGERSRRRVMLWNWAARCVVVAFVTTDLVVLVVLIVLDLMIGGV